MDFPTFDTKHICKHEILLFPPFYEKVKLVIAEFKQQTGHDVFVFETFRDPRRQRYLYAQGRTRPGRIITSKETESMHVVGLAVDIIGDKDPNKPGLQDPYGLDWPLFAAIVKKHGLKSGGAWGDWVHIEWDFANYKQNVSFWDIIRDSQYNLLTAWKELIS